MAEKRQEILRRLVDQIQNGELVRGNKLLTEREIASALGTSRFLIREALGALEAIGMVEVRERQGTFLCERSDDFTRQLMRFMPGLNLNQVMEARFVLEIPAAGLAAMRCTMHDKEVLMDCVAHLKEIQLQGEPTTSTQGAQWNTLLHRAIFQATQNDVMCRLFEGLMERMERDITMLRVRYMNFPEAALGDLILDQHQRLSAAIISGDVCLSQKIMEEHLRQTEKDFADQGKPGFTSETSSISWRYIDLLPVSGLPQNKRG